RKDEVIDEAAVRAKFGVPPASIPDYLALVGDSADGYPGLPGWGSKGTSTVLAKFEHIEAIPASAADWGLSTLRGADRLAATLQEDMTDALLFKHLATVVTDVEVGAVDDWRWTGPTDDFLAVANEIGAPHLHERA